MLKLIINLINDFLIFFIIATGINLIILKTKKYHINFSQDEINKNHAIHNEIIPRVGGVTLIILVLIQSWYAEFKLYELITTISIFLIGFYEDIKKNLNKNIRLILLAIVCLVYVLISNNQINTVGVEYLDQILKYYPASVLFTSFCLLGVINACNIIDGLNGLLVSVLIIPFIFLIVESSNAIYLLAAILSFFIFNYPSAKLFLGDGGAYVLGFIYASISINIVNTNIQISPWVFINLLSIPIIEVLYSIYRRKINLFSADSKHLHHLLAIKYNKKKIPVIYFITSLLIFIITLTNLKNHYFQILLFIFIFICYCFFYIKIKNEIKKNN